MKLDEIYSVIDNEAPFELSKEYCEKFSAYDNSGLLIDGGDSSITSVLFSLDFSVKAVQEAVKQGFNLIVTHHPAIYGGLNNLLTRDDPTAQAIARSLRGKISVISAHLNLDVAPEGIDYHLMKGLGGDECEIMDELSFEGSGYGRAYGIERKKLAKVIEDAKKTFSTKRIIAYGDENKDVKRIASFSGAGCNERSVKFAVENGVDLFVSSDLKHDLVAELLEHNICVLQLTHYAAENYGFKKFAAKIKKRIGIPSVAMTDKDLI